MVSQRPPILIAGGGIGGLAAALALMRHGFAVTVLEQAPAIADLGAGLQISANGACALFALGLESALRAVWFEPTGKEVRLWNTGETWKLFDLGAVSRARYGAPYFMIHRADLHAVLMQAVTGASQDALRFGTACAGFVEDAERVHVAVAGGERVDGMALIAADGVHSRIRDALSGEKRARFAGLVAWRGVVPMQALPPRLRRPVGTNWVGPGGHVVHYPVRRGELLNFVGIVERDDWRVESWTERGSREECRADFAGWHADVHRIIDCLDAPFKWALVGREPLPRWSAGRVTLLGDAAHPTLPMMAQGANMALEDAVVLARCLAMQREDVPGALRRYEAARLSRTTRLVRAASDNAARFHNPVLATRDGAKAYVEAEWQEAKVKARYDWVFDYDATRAPI